jgi:thioredoxin 1
MKANKINRHNEIILNFFYKDNNHDCQITRKALYNILDNYFDDIVMREINFDKNYNICKAYNVYGVPTLLILNNNKILNRYSGILNSQEIKSVLDQLLRVSR